MSATPGNSLAKQFPRLALCVSVAAFAFGCRDAKNPPGKEQTPGAVAQSEIPPQDHSPAWFREVTDASGVQFRHFSGVGDDKPFPAANGSGVGALDYDRDGQLDLYFATGTSIPLEAAVATRTDRFYRNDGNWKFSDVTTLANLGRAGFSAGIAAADYNNDGFTDLYVTRFGSNMLYCNQGDGTFEEVSIVSGADHDGWASSAAFFDSNADGALDLYVCNYAKWDYKDHVFCGDRSKGVRLFCSPTSVEAESDVLLANHQDGTFSDQTKALGLGEQAGRGQGVIAADLNADGWIDLYVANDLNANFLFTNNGDGTYRDATELSGAGYDAKGGMQAGMGVDAEDIDGDGRPELFVTNFKAEQNTLYHNADEFAFADVSAQYGLSAASLPYVGWGTAFGDFDLDGRSDLVVTNGHVDDNRHLLGQDAPYAVRPLLWRNGGRRFEVVEHAENNYFSGQHVGRGLTCVDLDNDLDEDLVISHQDARPALLENHAASRALAVQVQLVGVLSNRDATGATLTLQTSGRSKHQQIKGGGSYLSARDLRQTFAILPGEANIQLKIRWPSREETTIEGLVPGGRFIIIEGDAPGQAPIVHKVGEKNE
ncbi:MAG: RNA-binding protein [Planctomycetaceae bacterium]|nr:RNA-binding protein [Planctomycetaceae bacterium]